MLAASCVCRSRETFSGAPMMGAISTRADCVVPAGGGAVSAVCGPLWPAPASKELPDSQPPKARAENEATRTREVSQCGL